MFRLCVCGGKGGGAVSTHLVERGAVGAAVRRTFPSLLTWPLYQSSMILSESIGIDGDTIVASV
jgi:hypothetical protein